MNTCQKSGTPVGVLLGRSILSDFGFDANDTARAVNEDLSVIEAVFTGGQSIGARLALKLEAVFHYKADVIMTVQAEQELANAGSSAWTRWELRQLRPLPSPDWVR